MDLPIPLYVVYAGLGGTLIALIVATATNNWKPRVFFLLALRLAIGWHFLFEGMHKIHSHLVGPTETNRPFSSEMYFRTAPGPLGAYMRKQFGDPTATIDAKVRPAREYTAKQFAELPEKEQAAACPWPVAQELETEALHESARNLVKARAEADLKAANEAEAKATKEARTDADRQKAKAQADSARLDARKRAETYVDGGQKLVTAAQARYARWVHGVEGRDTKVKFVTGDVALTAPERLQHLAWLRRQVEEAEARAAAELGNGNGTESKRAAEARTEFVTAEIDLARDAEAFIAELKQELGGKPAESAEPSRGKMMDQVTMWALVVIGACLLSGFLTRPMAVAGVAFLALTYLAHPPYPWYPLPPNTEGNPVFINKNVIEALGLLVICCFPTGRWLGIDALLYRICCGPSRRSEPEAADRSAIS
jgi:uncharacterized membrane protein YphA (DoxX/SURF4 family)